MQKEASSTKIHRRSCMTYSDRLRTAMNNANVSPAQLSEHLGVTRGSVSLVLNGKSSSFSALNHVKTALYLKCDSLWLANGSRAYAPIAPPAPHHVGENSNIKPWAWPFKTIEFARVNKLGHDELMRLEGAWLLTAKQLGFDIAKQTAS
jgi:transcriptional regulator with XRE-family HTH domain